MTNPQITKEEAQARLDKAAELFDRIKVSYDNSKELVEDLSQMLRDAQINFLNACDTVAAFDGADQDDGLLIIEKE